MGVAKCLSQGDFGAESHLASQLLPLSISSLFSSDRLDTENRVPTLEVIPFCEAKPKNVGEKSASEPLLSKTRTGL
jgi:hypothetical protein